jgi:FKBP-type peptidyl-prolyl cis-trans isomerase SlyD
MAAADAASPHFLLSGIACTTEGRHMLHPVRFFASSVFVVLAFFATACATAEEESQMIDDNKQVSFTYALSVEGEVIENNTGQEPFVYIQGTGQILPALEAELAGLKAGDEKSVSLEAVNAYGEVNQEAFQEVPADQIPGDARVVGSMLQSQGHNGPIRVAEVKEEVVILDFNHPLAGKDLTFDVTILAVIDAPSPENAPPPPAN